MLTQNETSVEKQTLNYIKALMDQNAFFHADLLLQEFLKNYTAYESYHTLSLEDLEILRQAYTFQTITNIKILANVDEVAANISKLSAIEECLLDKIKDRFEHAKLTSNECLNLQQYRDTIAFNLNKHQEYLVWQQRIFESVQEEIEQLQNKQQLEQYLSKLQQVLFDQKKVLIEQEKALLQQQCHLEKQVQDTPPPLQGDIRQHQLQLQQQQAWLQHREWQFQHQQEHILQIQKGFPELYQDLSQLEQNTIFYQQKHIIDKMQMQTKKHQQEFERIQDDFDKQQQSLKEQQQNLKVQQKELTDLQAFQTSNTVQNTLPQKNSHFKRKKLSLQFLLNEKLEAEKELSPNSLKSFLANDDKASSAELNTSIKTPTTPVKNIKLFASSAANAKKSGSSPLTFIDETKKFIPDKEVGLTFINYQLK